MRHGGLLLLVLIALAIPGATLASASTDKGSDRPPRALTDDVKAVWMTEWTACWHVRMGYLARIFKIPIRANTTPQMAAQKLSKRAVKDLYDAEEDLKAGADGCRNGILWRYYHP